MWKIEFKEVPKKVFYRIDVLCKYLLYAAGTNHIFLENVENVQFDICQSQYTQYSIWHDKIKNLHITCNDIEKPAKFNKKQTKDSLFNNEVVIFDSVFHSFCTTFLSDRFFAQIAILPLMFFFCFPCFLDCCLFVFLDGSAYYFDDFMRKVTGFYRLMYGSVNGRPHYVARNCGDPDRYGTNCTYIWYSG